MEGLLQILEQSFIKQMQTQTKEDGGQKSTGFVPLFSSKCKSMSDFFGVFCAVYAYMCTCVKYLSLLIQASDEEVELVREAGRWSRRG